MLVRPAFYSNSFQAKLSRDGGNTFYLKPNWSFINCGSVNCEDAIYSVCHYRFVCHLKSDAITGWIKPRFWGFGNITRYTRNKFF